MGGAQFGILDGRGRQSQRERHENEKPFREERHGAYCRELRSARETGRTANTPRHSASLAPHWGGPRGWSNVQQIAYVHWKRGAHGFRNGVALEIRAHYEQPKRANRLLGRNWSSDAASLH